MGALTREMVAHAYYQATNLQKTPKEIIDRLFEELEKALRDTVAESRPQCPSEIEVPFP